jgi:hypothetical protein
MMRLSEAILLGSKIIPPKPGTVGRIKQAGCAMGMAVAATRDHVIRYKAFSRRWPWVANRYKKYPCDCPHQGVISLANTVEGIIAHLFDQHVMQSGGSYTPWTLEQLADWVRSVEPDESAAPTTAPSTIKSKEVIHASK